MTTGLGTRTKTTTTTTTTGKSMTELGENERVSASLELRRIRLLPTLFLRSSWRDIFHLAGGTEGREGDEKDERPFLLMMGGVWCLQPRHFGGIDPQIFAVKFKNLTLSIRASGPAQVFCFRSFEAPKKKKGRDPFSWSRRLVQRLDIVTRDFEVQMDMSCSCVLIRWKDSKEYGRGRYAQVCVHLHHS